MPGNTGVKAAKRRRSTDAISKPPLLFLPKRIPRTLEVVAVPDGVKAVERRLRRTGHDVLSPESHRVRYVRLACARKRDWWR